MAIWKEQPTATKEPTPMAQPTPTPTRDDTSYASSTPSYNTSTTARQDGKETLIAANLAIEGKIQGSGHVRVAGQFKGDINVEGNLTIEKGAKVTGGVRANTVTIAGELEGNVDAASRVELIDSGVLNGDLKAGSLTVAAGSRMRGQAEFGWEDSQQTQRTTTKARTESITAT